MKVLLNVFHPNLATSRGNKTLLEAASGLANVTINDLYGHYGAVTAIDAERESALLASHDAVVFQHPLYWYSGPVLMKVWVEQALVRGWAYPPTVSQALKGKLWAHAVTASGPDWAYGPEGYNKISVAEYLAPYRGTARLCAMEWREPFCVYSVLAESQEKSWAGAPNISAQELASAASNYRNWLSNGLG